MEGYPSQSARQETWAARLSGCRDGPPASKVPNVSALLVVRGADAKYRVAPKINGAVGARVPVEFEDDGLLRGGRESRRD